MTPDPVHTSPTNSECRWAMFTHLSALLSSLAWLNSIPLPGLNLIAPFVLWVTFRENSSFVDRHGKESLNFNLNCAVAGIPLTLLTFNTAGSIVVWLLAFLWAGAVGFAARKAFQGKDFRYPLIFRAL